MKRSGHPLCTFGLNRVLQFLVLTSVCWTNQDIRVEATTCNCAADFVSYCTAGHKATSCSEVKSVNPAADDGEYTLHPFSADNDVSLRVYCHVIASENPKEFLTLPAGAEENYSIVSSDQLLGSTWFLCPGILQQDQYVSRAGTTKFSKLRIKFENSSVEVIRVDYTFASTCGPNEISYAHAGDCYSEG
ncbi:A disintegrin and metalloproteinase with thrombospondin motifs 9-like [Branchiostoma floridae x Branchiostoma belcheri]